MQNPADICTRKKSFNSKDAFNFWLKGPKFLLQDVEDPSPVSSASAVRAISVPAQLKISEITDDSLHNLIKSEPHLYTLKKRFAYLNAFKQFLIAQSKDIPFQRPELNTSYLDRGFMDAVKYVQFQSFGAAITLLKEGYPDNFDQMLKKLQSNVNSAEQMRKITELKTLRNLRLCVDAEFMLRVEGRLENAEPPIDTRYPFILPSKHALTRLIILNEHKLAGHAVPLYTLMQTRQRCWAIFGNGSVKFYISECAECALQKAKLIRQLMADLPSFRVTTANKPFQICGTDFLGPILYRQNRSDWKAWGLLFTCLSTRCLHVEIVTGLDLNEFLLAFSRFTNLRGSVDTLYSDNGITFCAAADVLPKLINSTEFNNAIRKRGINWVRIPPYAPFQGGS